MGTSVDDRSTVEPDPADSQSTVGPSPGVARSTRYRYLIPLVRQIDTTVTIDRLVDPMLHWERELTSGDSEKSWGDIHEELFLVDLPVLDRVGLVDFDASSGLVSTDEE